MDSERRLGAWAALLFGVTAVLELLIRVTIQSVAPFYGKRTQPGPLDIHIVGAATSVSSQGAVGLFALCLLGTLPLGLLRPAAGGVAVTVANTLSLGLFGVLTIAALAAQLLAGYRAGRLSSGRGEPQVLAVALAVPFVVMALAGSVHGESRVVVVLLASVAPAAALAGVTRRREALVAGAAEEVMAGTMVEHLARGERARIARELHDVVAHHISMVAVQAETARLTTPGMPADGARRLSEIGDTARAGLTEMRRLLGVLREDVGDAAVVRHPQPGLAQLAELIDSARQTSGAGVRLIVSGPVAPLDPGIELAAYRIVQEALTNARRHAPGTAVDVELRYRGETLQLRVRDNGPGPVAAAAAASVLAAAAVASPEAPGHGLLGMRERAASVGGSLRTGAAPGGGFLVEAELPTRKETP
jgi:signal transduction histidine kinase